MMFAVTSCRSETFWEFKQFLLENLKIKTRRKRKYDINTFGSQARNICDVQFDAVILNHFFLFLA